MGIGPSDLGRKEGEEGAGALVTFRANNISSKKNWRQNIFTSVSKWKPQPDWQAGRRAEGRGSYLSSQP